MSDEKMSEWSRTVEIEKIDTDQHLVFGWLSVSKTKDGKFVVDHHGHVIEPDVLEVAAYDFVLQSRRGADMHKANSHVATLVESIMFTRQKMAAMGIPEGILPEGMWTGWWVHDEDVWEKIITKQYKMLSFGGTAIIGETYEP